MRVVSLVPSATETLIAIGVTPVACTRFCEQPGLPTVGGTKNPAVDAIISLQPDLVVVDTEENRREDAEALSAAGLALLITEVHSVGDALEVPGRLAATTGVSAPPVMALPPPAEPRLRAFVPIWRRPWMSIAAGTYGGSLLAACGVELVTAAAESAYPQVELPAVAALRPDLVLVPSEPYEFSAAHLAEIGAVLDDVPIHRIDGQDLFWWGARTAAAIERLTGAAARW